MEHSEAILIHTHAFSDTSLIAVWCTDGHGIVRTAARGARRPKSAFNGKLDLFFTGEISWQEGKSDLHPLREVVINNYREALRRSYLTTLMASYFAQLVERCIEPGQPVPEIYDLLSRGLNYLENSDPNQKALIHFEREFAKIEGCYRPGTAPARLIENQFGSLPRMRVDLTARLD